MSGLEKLVTKLPPYIKQFYVDTAQKYGQKTGPYASMVLIKYAIDKGSATEKIES